MFHAACDVRGVKRIPRRSSKPEADPPGRAVRRDDARSYQRRLLETGYSTRSLRLIRPDRRAARHHQRDRRPVQRTTRGRSRPTRFGVPPTTQRRHLRFRGAAPAANSTRRDTCDVSLDTRRGGRVWQTYSTRVKPRHPGDVSPRGRWSASLTTGDRKHALAGSRFRQRGKAGDEGSTTETTTRYTSAQKDLPPTTISLPRQGVLGTAEIGAGGGRVEPGIHPCCGKVNGSCPSVRTDVSCAGSGAFSRRDCGRGRLVVSLSHRRRPRRARLRVRIARVQRCRNRGGRYMALERRYTPGFTELLPPAYSSMPRRVRDTSVSISPWASGSACAGARR